MRISSIMSFRPSFCQQMKRENVNVAYSIQSEPDRFVSALNNPLLDETDRLRKYFDLLPDDKLAERACFMAKKYGVIPFEVMSDDSIDRVIENATDKQVKKLALAENDTGANIFQLSSDADKLRKISSRLKEKDVKTAIFEKNIVGSNAFHSALFNAPKAQVLCDVLDEKDVRRALLVGNKYEMTPFHDSSDEVFEVLMDKLSPDNAAKVVEDERETEPEGESCFYKFKKDRMATLCSKLSPVDVERFATQKEPIWENTPLHTQSPEVVRVLLDGMTNLGAIRAIDIPNSYGFTPFRRVEFDSKFANIYKSYIR